MRVFTIRIFPNPQQLLQFQRIMELDRRVFNEVTAVRLRNDNAYRRFFSYADGKVKKEGVYITKPYKNVPQYTTETIRLIGDVIATTNEVGNIPEEYKHHILTKEIPKKNKDKFTLLYRNNHVTEELEPESEYVPSFEFEYFEFNRKKNPDGSDDNIAKNAFNPRFMLLWFMGLANYNHQNKSETTDPETAILNEIRYGDKDLGRPNSTEPQYNDLITRPQQKKTDYTSLIYRNEKFRNQGITYDLLKGCNSSAVSQVWQGRLKTQKDKVLDGRKKGKPTTFRFAPKSSWKSFTLGSKMKDWRIIQSKKGNNKTRYFLQLPGFNHAKGQSIPCAIDIDYLKNKHNSIDEGKVATIINIGNKWYARLIIHND